MNNFAWSGEFDPGNPEFVDAVRNHIKQGFNINLHQAHDPNCESCPLSYPKDHECGGLLHAQVIPFIGEYVTQCDKCGLDESVDSAVLQAVTVAEDTIVTKAYGEVSTDFDAKTAIAYPETSSYGDTNLSSVKHMIVVLPQDSYDKLSYFATEHSTTPVAVLESMVEILIELNTTKPKAGSTGFAVKIVQAVNRFLSSVVV